MKTSQNSNRLRRATLTVGFVALGVLSIMVVQPVSAATSKAQLKTQLIVPGVRVGHLRLGHNGAAQLRQMAKPTAEDAGMSQTRQVWVSKDKARNTLFLHTVSNGALNVAPLSGVTIDTIRVTSSFFHTRNGISTRSTLAQVKKAFPKMNHSLADGIGGKTVIYDDARHGIAFEFARESASARCIGITSYIAGKGNDAGGPVSRQEVATLLHDR